MADVRRRFGYKSEAELQADLDLLFMCGIYPYTPDSLIEVDIAEGRVWIRYADWFARPLRLTPAEALSLVAASSALLGAEDHDAQGPLARGLAKVAAALGVDGEEVVDVELGPAPPATLADLQRAVAEHRQVEIDYYGFGRDARSTRVIDPTLVYSADGQWYVAAYCHRAEADRLFRVDRVEAARLLDTTFTAAPAAEPRPVYQPGPDDPRIVLDLAADAGWVTEQYPVEDVTPLGGGRTQVALRVSGSAWLDRLLLRLGPSARVVEGASGVGRAAAQRVLERYGARPPSH